MNLLIAFLLGSLFLNTLFIYFDFFPYFQKRFLKKKYLNNEPLVSFSFKVFEAAKVMIFSDKNFMNMTEKNDVISKISLFLKGKKFRKFQKYSYPKAFLFLGALRYTLVYKDKVGFIKLKNRFDALYVFEDGNATFEFDKVDQTVFALVALLLYDNTGETKYKTFADSFFLYLQSQKGINGIIPYRKGSKVQYVDLLGMICPFLIEYGLLFKVNDALNLAYIQMNYWIEKGIDMQSHLPFHCIHLKTLIKIGPTNWGRGIGWYGLALAYIVSKTNDNNNPYYSRFLFELNELKHTLQSLKNKESLWGQFPGNPKGNGLSFDASASLTYLYMNALMTQDSCFETSIVKYTLKDGFIDFTSGDTEGINQYSHVYSKSEYSQGMLLLYLSELK